MIAGIDIDTHHIHVVTLDDDSQDAEYRGYPIDVGPGDYHERARRLPTCIPYRGAWRDAGVRLIAIEEPRGSHMKGVVPQAVIRGALLAALLELFARRQRLGWDTWGDEALNHVELAETSPGRRQGKPPIGEGPSDS